MNRRELLGVLGFSWFSLLLGVRHEQQMGDDGWRSADNPPEMLRMSLYVTGPLVSRSLNVLCENESQVFYGYACPSESGYVRWFTEDDYTQLYMMVVDRWKPINVDPKKLHCQWNITDSDLAKSHKADYAEGRFPKMKITKRV